MLVIGFSQEEGFIGSREVNLNDSQAIGSFMHKEFGTWFDQILIVENNEVTQHWNLGREYHEL